MKIVKVIWEDVYSNTHGGWVEKDSEEFQSILQGFQLFTQVGIVVDETRTHLTLASTIGLDESNLSQITKLPKAIIHEVIILEDVADKLQ